MAASVPELPPSSLKRTGPKQIVDWWLRWRALAVEHGTAAEPGFPSSGAANRRERVHGGCAPASPPALATCDLILRPRPGGDGKVVYIQLRGERERVRVRTEYMMGLLSMPGLTLTFEALRPTVSKGAWQWFHFG